MNIAIMASGGDCSGMNPATKRFVEYSYERGIAPFFIYNGIEGMIDGDIKKAEMTDVSGIIFRGGTIIRSSRSKRFYEKRYRKKAADNLKKNKIDTVLVMGGDGSFKAMETLHKETGIDFIGIPATIDNDIYGTDYCLGVDTSLNIIRGAIDDIRDTASSFNRAFVIETMGRECGYLALVSALTSGAEMCLIPEAPFDLDSLKRKYLKQIECGRRYFIAIVSEGLKISEKIRDWFENEIKFETRLTVLGHIQRGGNPTVFDRLMAFEFVTHAINSALKKEMNKIVVYREKEFKTIESSEVTSRSYTIDAKLVKQAEYLMK